MEVTIEEYVEYLKEKKSISVNTELSYRGDLKYLAEYLGGQGIYEVGKVTVTNLNSYLLYLEKQGVSNATLARKLTVIRRFFEYAFRRHLIAEDIVDDLKGPKVERKAPRKMKDPDVKKLISMPTGSKPREGRDRMILRLLYEADIKISELLAVRLCDVNLAVGFIRCINNKSERMVSISAETVQVLREYIENCRPLLSGQNGEILFPNAKGESLTRQGVWKMTRRYAGAAGIEESVTPKMLRNPLK